MASFDISARLSAIGVPLPGQSHLAIDRAPDLFVRQVLDFEG